MSGWSAACHVCCLWAPSPLRCVPSSPSSPRPFDFSNPHLASSLLTSLPCGWSGVSGRRTLKSVPRYSLLHFLIVGNGAAGAASLTCSANGKSGLRRGRCRSDRHPQRMCQQDRRVPLFLKCELFVCEKDARVFNVNIRPSSPPERETDSAVRPRAVPL